MSGSTGAAEPDERERLRTDLLRFLGVRERSTQEVARYLRRRGHRPELIARALREAQEEGFVDDRRFATMFLRDRRRLRPMGRRAILRDLQQRGVPREIGLDAFELCDPPWDEREVAAEALAGRWRRWQPEVRRRRAAGFLQRRGFDTSTIREVLEHFAVETGGEAPEQER